MRIFCNRPFARFAKRAKITHQALREAITRAERGLIDADLGGGIIKQRIARPGGGKSGGFRTVIAVRFGDKAFFVYGFAKNEQDNISRDDLAALKLLGSELLGYTDAELSAAMATEALMEICDEQEIP